MICAVTLSPKRSSITLVFWDLSCSANLSSRKVVHSSSHRTLVSPLEELPSCFGTVTYTLVSASFWSVFKNCLLKLQRMAYKIYRLHPTLTSAFFAEPTCWQIQRGKKGTLMQIVPPSVRWEASQSGSVVLPMQAPQETWVWSLSQEDPLREATWKWQPTSRFSPGQSHGQKSLAGHSA